MNPQISVHQHNKTINNQALIAFAFCFRVSVKYAMWTQHFFQIEWISQFLYFLSTGSFVLVCFLSTLQKASVCNYPALFHETKCLFLFYVGKQTFAGDNDFGNAVNSFVVNGGVPTFSLSQSNPWNGGRVLRKYWVRCCDDVLVILNLC